MSWNCTEGTKSKQTPFYTLRGSVNLDNPDIASGEWFRLSTSTAIDTWDAILSESTLKSDVLNVFLRSYLDFNKRGS